MKETSIVGNSTANREIATIRTYDCPIALIWRAWTEPERIGQWWGPYGFTTTTHSMDVRVGGEWRFIMHGPDGTDYDNLVEYTRVEEGARLEYKHGEPDDPDQFRTEVRFTEENGKTILSMRALFPTSEERDEAIRRVGADEGMFSTLNRLGEYLRLEQ